MVGPAGFEPATPRSLRFLSVVCSLASACDDAARLSYGPFLVEVCGSFLKDLLVTLRFSWDAMGLSLYVLDLEDSASNKPFKCGRVSKARGR